MKTRTGVWIILIFGAVFSLKICVADPNAPLSPTAPPEAKDQGKSSSAQEESPKETPPAPPPPPAWTKPTTPERLAQRQEMVQTIKKLYGFSDEKILQAMEHVPRHWFVPDDKQSLAYADMPLPIGHGQTISQPFIVAYMTSLLQINDASRVLEIGTGSGYQAAVLNEFTSGVYTVEIIPPLAEKAALCLTGHDYQAIHTRTADGYQGWKEHAPYDAIIVTAAADHIPSPLIEQLKPGGRMCIPIGAPFRVQNLMLISKDLQGKITSQALMPVRFVPLTRPDRN